MKSVKFDLKYVIVLTVFMAIFSCSKDEAGPTGPQGPQGEQGIQGSEGPQGPAGQDGEALGVPGPQGPQGQDGVNGADGADGQDGADGADGQDGADGADGADGQDGAVNVIATSWVTLANADWTINATSDRASASVNAPLITSSVMNNNVILVYQKSQIPIINSISVRMLPTVFENESTTFSIKVGQLNLSKLKTDGTAVTPPGSNTSFRYVIIPPSTGGKLLIDFEKMTYKEVMDHFDLEY